MVLEIFKFCFSPFLFFCFTTYSRCAVLNIFLKTDFEVNIVDTRSSLCCLTSAGNKSKDNILGISRTIIKKYILRVHSDGAFILLRNKTEDTVVKLVMKAAIGYLDEHLPFHALQTTIWLRFTSIFNAVPLLLCIPTQHHPFQAKC